MVWWASIPVWSPPPSPHLAVSSNPAWDETVLRAIDKTRQLPLDNGRIPSTMILVFRQDEVR